MTSLVCLARLEFSTHVILAAEMRFTVSKRSPPVNTRLWFSPQLSVNIRGKIFLFQDRFNSSSLNSYRAEESKENLITCRPATQEQPQKPAKLSRLEVDSLKLRTESVLEAVWSAGDKPGQVTQICISSFL